ncbi:hypothetical protein [Bdellovibrio sp. HCB2-146]|uniref:hypothetical protein n=1 Tax=Bdellovibrio sp. HCB2-146 TaxID=3394362 RepID=UPI0039BD0C3A
MNVRLWGLLSLITCLAMLASDISFAKASQSSGSQSGKKLSMNDIQCVFSGRNTRTTTIGSLDFPVDDSNTVCDPLSNSTADVPTQGLLGKLILKSDQMSSNPKSVLEFHEKGTRMPQDLYFADVNVPTRQFTEGFVTRSGEVLVDANNQKLIENFAVEYTSSLKLQPSDKAGHYEIALLSDDGARLFIKEGDKYNEILNNDGVHSTRMGCSFRTVYLDHNTEIPIKILYYQGPRYHIANVMIWKHHKKAKSWKEPNRHSLCGFQGNNLFFNEKSNRETVAMKVLKLDKWKVVAPANFKMPESKPNPCVEEKLEISNVVPYRSGTSGTISWKTNLPASSQVRITNTDTGEQFLSDIDTNLVTEHTVTITNLNRGTNYTVEVISRDASGVEVVGYPPVPF